MSRGEKGTGIGGGNINTFSARPERASATPCMQRNKQPGTFSLHEVEGTQESTRNTSLVITIKKKTKFRETRAEQGGKHGMGSSSALCASEEAPASEGRQGDGT
jgi:hypothetical protein